MRITKIFSLLILSTFFMLSSCADNANTSVASAPFELTGPEIVVWPATQRYIDVDLNLWPYFENFEKAAKARGLFLDLKTSGMSADIDMLSTGFLSDCMDDGTTHHMTIDKAFWTDPTTTDTYRELIVFNALGYCYLGRSHKEDASVNGICLSIMRSGDGSCQDNYNANTRDAYLDELFQVQ